MTVCCSCLTNAEGPKDLIGTYSSDDPGSGTPSRVQYASLAVGIGLPSPKHCSSMRYPTAWYTVSSLIFTTGATVNWKQDKILLYYLK